MAVLVVDLGRSNPLFVPLVALLDDALVAAVADDALVDDDDDDVMGVAGAGANNRSNTSANATLRSSNNWNDG